MGEGVAFVLITVVRAVRPTSGKPGDKAILTEHGEWLGWVGGSCAEPTARRAALRALDDGECRLIHLTNEETDFARSGVEVEAMTCHSGGSLELYVEPHLPQPCLVVFGTSPIARALCELGRVMKYRVTRVDLRSSSGTALPGDAEEIPYVRDLSELGERSGRAPFVVVASHGHFEQEALTWALASGAPYVGLVTSERRWSAMQNKLTERGIGPDQLARVRAPAGLRIAASGADEVALSVLSEIVATRRGAVAGPIASVATPGAASVTSEPVAEDCCAVRPAIPRPEASAPKQASCCDPPLNELASARASGSARAGGGAANLPRFSAIVLAAGLSRRMGAPNKLLLPVEGQPMIRHVLSSVLAADFAEVVVVLGHQAVEVGAAIASLGVRTVYNADFESGQVSSVRAGLGALKEPTDAVMVCLGDQPLLTPADIRAEQAAFAGRSHGSILVPMYGRERGNPVVIDWESAEETLSRGTNFGCRHFMEEHPERVYSWPIDSDHFVRDVDQPGDYQALVARPGQ